MSNRWRWSTAMVVLCSLGSLPLGCESGASGPRSTRLRVGDMQQVVDQTVAQLANSDWLGGGARDRDSADRIVLGVERVENRSSDVITRSEQWYMMQSVANAVVSSGLGRRTNLVMVIPAERLAQARRRATLKTVATSDRNVTHSMTAAIESITRSNTREGESREVFYSCVYRVVDLSSGEIVWEDRVEFSRAALGRSFH